ncbi:MAG: hypothetical protein WBN51_01490, partial [Gammaproteobacteria bacterium]
RGESRVRAHPSIREFRLKARPGDRVKQRTSIGQDCGHLLHASASSVTRLQLHKTLGQQFAIEVD